MKSKMMRLSTKLTAAIMVASALVTSVSPAMVKADDSVAITESFGPEETTVESETAEEAVVEEVVMEEPVVVEEVVEEPVVDEMVMEETVVDEMVAEPEVADVVVEEAVTEEEVEEIAFVEFVDNGYEKPEVDPEVERVVAEVERNMEEAAENANQDASSFVNLLSNFDSEESVMDAADAPVQSSDKESEAKAKEKKDKEKKEQEEQINKAGAIAGNYIVELSRIDFDKEDAPEQAALLTFKTINETLVPEIPYVGGLLSALVGLTYAEDNKVKIVESEETKQLRKTNSLLNETIETIKNAAEKQINANKEQNLRAEFGDMQAAAKELTNEYGSLNPAFITVMQNLHTMSYPPLEDAEAVFKQIYNEENNLNDKTYFSAYINFIDKVMNDTPFSSEVSGSDIFATYDDINTIGKDKKDLKYLFNDDRAVLTDKVENISEVGYCTLRYCMEVEFAKQKNVKAAYKEMLDGEGGRKEELKAQAASLENDFKELQENYRKATGEEKKAIREKMLSDNNQMTNINNEVELINNKCAEYEKMINRCDMAIARIESDTETLNAKKKLADDIISKQRESICDGEEFMENHSEQQEEINVYVDKAEAVEFELNGKKLLAYPKFKHGDTRVEYVDIFGNVWAHQDVTYEKREWPEQLRQGGTYLFDFNGAGKNDNPWNVGEKGVRVKWWNDKEIYYICDDGWPRSVNPHSLAGVREYTIGDFKEEFK